jgi:hypothetical protein
MNLQTFPSRDDAADFAKAKRAEGFKTSMRPFENGSRANRSTWYIVRWSAK